jgi:hypothetical protein
MMLVSALVLRATRLAAFIIVVQILFTVLLEARRQTIRAVSYAVIAVALMIRTLACEHGSYA